MLATLEEVADQLFDYIVVGGGTAGLVVAARLSENPSVSVCVLEAGGANIDDPALLRTGTYGTHFGNSLYDWGFMTRKQEHLPERICNLQSGRGLGGSSGINFMGWTRPPSEEVDDFERLGNPGWNWDNLLKYCKKAERFVEPSERTQQIISTSYEDWSIGRDGPLVVSFPRTISELAAHLHNTLLNSGVPAAPDPYGGKVTGAFYALNSQNPYNYSRSYVVPAYYLPNSDRRNLVVLVDAHVNRVLTELSTDGTLIATGVEFTHEGSTHRVNANKEVVLCAGALKSPHILELSGIGRKDVLDAAGISIRVDLPGVGENMQEHLLAGVSFEMKDGHDFPTYDVFRDPERLAQELELYKKGEGSLCLGTVNFAFLPVETISPRAEAIYQKAQRAVAKFDQENNIPGLVDQYRIQLERLQPGRGQPGPGCEFILTPGLTTPLPTPPGKKYIGIGLGLYHTFSRGSIHTVSQDPRHCPDIDPRYFESEIDIDIFVEMVKYARQLATVSPMKDLIVGEFSPGPEVQTDEQIADWLKQTFTTTWHTASTCSMLPRDKGGVVDHTLKVYGTENLRVVDLSVVPLHFAAHTQSMVYGIAEQAADIIRGRFGTARARL